MNEFQFQNKWVFYGISVNNKCPFKNLELGKSNSLCVKVLGVKLKTPSPLTKIHLCRILVLSFFSYIWYLWICYCDLVKFVFMVYPAFNLSLWPFFCHVGSLRLRSWFESAFHLFEVSRISSCNHWLCSVISQGNPKNYCHHFCCRRGVIKFQIPKKAKLHEPPSVRSFLRSFRTFKIIVEDVRIISFAANWCYKFCCSTHFRPIKYRSWLKISSCFFL